MSSHNLPRGLTDKGLTYHVTSKVNRDAFELEPDEMKKLFLTVIAEAKTSKGFKFNLWNFCIMGNHFHFLITPEKGESLSEILKWIKMVFAIRWNKKHHKTGHFWGDRFFSREIKDEKDFWTVFEYIDQNPVAAKLVQKPEEWQYSGAYHREHGIMTVVSLVTDTAWRTDLKLLL
ncbi:MAG: transposase [Spirochaetaceae bacterium]|jgi:putative transposase|nr:transposase [Spirochaetaceae bacterium]